MQEEPERRAHVRTELCPYQGLQVGLCPAEPSGQWSKVSQGRWEMLWGWEHPGQCREVLFQFPAVGLTPTQPARGRREPRGGEPEYLASPGWGGRERFEGSLALQGPCGRCAQSLYPTTKLGEALPALFWISSLGRKNSSLHGA